MKGDLQAPDKKRAPAEKAARLIIRSRWIIFVLFAAAALYCALSLGKVRLNGDLTAFLPEQSETRRAITAMSGEFASYGSFRAMAEDLSPDEAAALAGRIRQIDHVAGVSFDGGEKTYKDGYALYAVSFDLPQGDDRIDEAAARVEEVLEPYKHYTAYEPGSYSDRLAKEMVWLLLLAAAVIVAVLLFTSRSFFEVLIFLAVFAVAALFNMGTNHWLGEISTITNTVAVILQLALAIDYAIIFSHRYQSESARTDDDKEALTQALAHSIREISSSSLTTVAGLAALTLMQFGLGRDLGLVLAKGILCSMLTVFLLMPGLISLCSKPLLKTAHRPFVPSIRRFGGFVVRRRFLFLLIFALLLPFSVIFSQKVDYAFTDSAVSQVVKSDSRTAAEKINGVFSPDTAIVMVLPKGGEDRQKTILERARKVEGITSATGLAGIQVTDGLYLCDRITYPEAAALFGAEKETARGLYMAYAMTKSDGAAALRDLEHFGVRVIDLAFFLFEKEDEGALPGGVGLPEGFSSLREELERGAAQLSGRTKDRLLFSCAFAPESEEAAAVAEELRAIAEDESLYGKGGVLLAGDVTVARDLRDSYKSDSVLISVLTIVFVFVILLCTFRSFAAAAILVFVIQGSIWINFSFAYLFSMRPSFVTQMIVSAIQMGATIDYAIVFMSRYLARRRDQTAREAVIGALDDSFPTVLTSGSIMTVAGFLIAFRISDVYVGHIGLCVGRGAAVSALLVLTVLPQLTLLTDRLIAKTTFRLPGKKK